MNTGDFGIIPSSKLSLIVHLSMKLQTPCIPIMYLLSPLTTPMSKATLLYKIWSFHSDWKQASPLAPSAMSVWKEFPMLQSISASIIMDEESLQHVGNSFHINMTYYLRKLHCTHFTSLEHLEFIFKSSVINNKHSPLTTQHSIPTFPSILPVFSNFLSIQTHSSDEIDAPLVLYLGKHSFICIFTFLSKICL